MKAWGVGQGQAGRGQWGKKGDICNTFNNKDFKNKKRNGKDETHRMHLSIEKLITYKIQ